MSNTIQSKTLATTPLSTDDILAIVQGGVLKRTTVGDLPEGATVIENANGIAIRFPTGIQICWTLTPITATSVAITTAFAGGFRNSSNDAGTWTFPAAFADTNYYMMARPGAQEHLISQIINTNGSVGYARVFRVTSDTINTDWEAFAIGKWSA